MMTNYWKKWWKATNNKTNGTEIILIWKSSPPNFGKVQVESLVELSPGLVYPILFFFFFHWNSHGNLGIYFMFPPRFEPGPNSELNQWDIWEVVQNPKKNILNEPFCVSLANGRKQKCWYSRTLKLHEI